MTKEEFEHELRNILVNMELDDDGGCSDPECCGGNYQFVGGKGLDEAVEEIHELVTKYKTKSKTKEV